MKVFNRLVLLMLGFFFLSGCKEEMKIDPYLKEHSRKFAIESEGTGWNSSVKIGYFSSYNKQVGTLWMEEAGIAAFFDEDNLITFASDNNDNYSYDHILSEVSDASLLEDFAAQFDIPLEVPKNFKQAYVGYLYAGHDEYAMACIRDKNNELNGYLTNGFDIYRILPVWNVENDSILQGYQIKLYDEYVAAVQLNGPSLFRMTTEYCDATELILASIASMLVKCESQKI